MDGGAWWATVHGVVNSQTRLSDFTFTFHFHALEKDMATHSSVIDWRIPGMVEPGGLPSMGLHSEVKVAQSCLTLCDPMDFPWNSLGQNTGVGSLSVLQGIFLTQESNQGLLHCRRILYQLSYQRSQSLRQLKQLSSSSSSLLGNSRPLSPV